VKVLWRTYKYELNSLSSRSSKYILIEGIVTMRYKRIKIGNMEYSLNHYTVCGLYLVRNYDAKVIARLADY